jgi:hypothetical protein
MSIKGFKIKDKIERIDYESLENLPPIGEPYSDRLYEHFGIDKSQYPYITITADKSGLGTLYFTSNNIGFISGSAQIISSFYFVNNSSYKVDGSKIAEVIEIYCNFDNDKVEQEEGRHTCTLSTYNYGNHTINNEINKGYFFSTFDTGNLYYEIYNTKDTVNGILPKLEALRTDGIVLEDGIVKSSDGVSTNSNRPNGYNAWIEGSGGSYSQYVPEINSTGNKLVVTEKTINKNTTIIAYLQINLNSDKLAVTKDELNKCEYIEVVFKNDPYKAYYVKPTDISINNLYVEIKFDFFDNGDRFSITTSDNNRLIYSLKGYTNLGTNSHSENSSTAIGDNSHAEGEGTIAQSNAQHTQGKYNIVDTENKYAHIVGNGDNHSSRSNAHTIDWDGNGWFAGGIESQRAQSKYIGTNCIITGVWNGANITLVTTNTTHSTSTVLGNNLLIPGQYYLVVCDSVEYRCVCLGTATDISFQCLDDDDDDNKKWWLFQNDNYDTILLMEDDNEHTFSLSRVDLCIVDLCNYIDKLESRIKTLEEAQVIVE